MADNGKHGENRDHHRFDFGKWFMVYRPFFWMMSYQEAALLCFLINQQQRWAEGDPDTWFFCKVKTIERAIAMAENQQTRWLRGLQVKGFVKFERRGLPSRRWVQIQYAAIAEACDKVELPNFNLDE